MASHVWIPILFGHYGIENESRSGWNWREGVGSAVVTERVGLRAPHEEPSLCAGHRAAHDNDAQGAARSGDLAREIDAAMGASTVATEVERCPRSHVQAQVSRGLKSAEAVRDPEGARGSAGQLERPAAAFVRRRGADQVVGTTGKIGVALEADLGVGDWVAAGVTQAAPDQGAVAEGDSPLGLVVAGEACGDRAPASDR